MAALDGGRRNRRPVSNVLLKWQLQQDQKRLQEAQKRLERMASPTYSRQYQDRKPSVYRPNSLHNDPDEEALMDLIMEKEQRESSTVSEHKPSRIPYPSSFGRSGDHSLSGKPPRPSSSQTVKLRSTGQKLNAAGDFYSPQRPKEPAMSASGAGFSTRVNLAISRIKAPSSGLNGAPSPRTPLRYDQMRTPDRWRKTALQSNQDDLNESTLRRWEEEDAMQADRLLEKAARDDDHDAMWNDLFYGTKAARARNNQSSPENPVVYSTSSFPDMFSQPGQDPVVKSRYDGYTERPKSPVKRESTEKDFFGSELSTVLTSEQTKPCTSQQSDFMMTNSSALSPWKSVSQMLSSLTQALDADETNADDNERSGDDGDDKDHSSGDAAPAEDRTLAHVEVLPGIVLPLWSVIVVASCLVVGTGGFFVDELMGLIFTSSTSTLSKAERDRMRERISTLQQELQGFQLSTAEIEVRSQHVLGGLQEHMDKMKLDREEHQNKLAGEMQELRKYILQTTFELMEKERERIHARLQETVEVKVVDQDQKSVGPAIAESAAESEAIPTELASAPSDETPSEVADPASKVRGDEPTNAVQGDAVVRADGEFAQEAQKSARVGDTITSEPFIQPEQSDSSMQRSISDGQVEADARSSVGGSDDRPVILSKPAIKDAPTDPGTITQPKQEAAGERVSGQLQQATMLLPEQKIVQSIEVAAPVGIVVAKPQDIRSMSLETMLLLVGILFLGACVVLRVWNIYHRKKWLEQRRKRRNHRALLVAQERARAMAGFQSENELEDASEDIAMETVSLMTPPRDEDDNQSEDLQPEFDVANDDEIGLDEFEPTTRSVRPKSAVYRFATDERASHSRKTSPALLPHRSPQFVRERRHHRLSEY